VALAGITLGELILQHLGYLRSLRLPGRSAIQNHENMAQQRQHVRLRDYSAKNLIDSARVD